MDEHMDMAETRGKKSSWKVTIQLFENCQIVPGFARTILPCIAFIDSFNNYCIYIVFTYKKT